MASSIHKPVMLREVLQQMDLHPGQTVMDGTVGAGGHSTEIRKRIGAEGRIVGFDRDSMMLAFAAERLADPNTSLIHAPYSSAVGKLAEIGITHVDRVLLDLGLSSDQLSDRDRGFGFDAGGRLDMRFDVSRGVPVYEYLRKTSRDELVRVMSEFGEEPHAERIADALQHQRIESAEQLAELIRKAARSSGSRRDPATRVFQALRIAVNEELQHLEHMMSLVLPTILKQDGLAVIITFHSLEDRIVKSAFKGHQGWHVLTKTPLRPTPAEVRVNPRSRSAKLRSAKWTSP